MTEMLEIANWSQYQHYKYRSPPWIKLHQTIFASEDWVTLNDRSRLVMMVCMIVAARLDGLVPNNPDYLKRVAYLDHRPNLKPLIDCGFLEKVQADASAAQAHASTLQASATPETESETDKKEGVPNGTLSGDDLDQTLPDQPNPTPSKSDYDAAFEAIWTHWRCHGTPKGSKKKARERWKVHVVKPGRSIEAVIRGAAAYCTQCIKTDCKTSHVSTWLTNEGWIDDHADVKNDDLTAQADRMSDAWENLTGRADVTIPDDDVEREGAGQEIDP
tara:strand:- start:25692 stop:26513 length:822 start_codon:yes stop_codon:yes gene_type:complete